MSEQQHPFVEHESAFQDTAKLPIIKPPNNGSRSHSRASTLHVHQEGQASTLQSASNQFNLANEIYDQELDDSLAPTLKMPTLKKGHSPLIEQQMPSVPSSVEQEQPVAVTAYFSLPTAQQMHRAAPIADDYDFSEVDVDLVDMISYGLLQPDNKLSKEEQQILTEDAASSQSPADEALPLMSTTSSSLVEESTPLSETEVSMPTEEEMSAVDSEEQIAGDEEIVTSGAGSYEEMSAADSEEQIAGDEETSTPDTRLYNEEEIANSSIIDAETVEVGGNVQTHTEDQFLPFEEEAFSSISDVPPAIEQDTKEQDTGEEVQNIADDTATVSIEQEPEASVTSSSLPPQEGILVHVASKQEETPPEEAMEIPDTTLSAAPIDENLTEEAQDEPQSDTSDITITSDTPSADLVDESLPTAEPLSETTEAALTADTAVEEAFPSLTADTQPALSEEHVETEQGADEEKIADERPITLETPISTAEPEHVTGEEVLADEQAVAVEALAVQEPEEEIADEQLATIEDAPSAKESTEARAEEQPPVVEAASRPAEGELVTGEEVLASEQALTVQALEDVQEPIEKLADEQPQEAEDSPSAREPMEARAEEQPPVVEVPPATKEAVEAGVEEQRAVVEEISGAKVSGEEIADVVDAQPVAVAEVPGAKDSIRESVETAAPVETEVDTEDVGVAPAAVEATSVSPAPERPTSETQVIVRQRKKYRLSRREIGSLVLLALFVVSTMLLWRDLTATHVYLNALDPNNGKVLTQQDLGGYQDHVALTAPISESSQVYVGIHGNDPQSTQQIMSLSGNTNSWYMGAKFAAPLAGGTLSGTADGHLFAVGTNGLQVMTANGHILWSLQEEQPSQGTHHYQPISDSQTLYAVASLKNSQVAAYDLQHGTRLWIQTLDDTLNATPPFLLDENTLYVASDHKLYALNSSDGSLRWEKPYPSRTLLMENEGETQLLLAAGAQGLTAFNPATGALVWSFDGQLDDTFTSAQFYQAALASTEETNGNVVYTTGIVWQMPQVQEQVWLYALNAATGTLLWSQQVGAGFLSADAARTLLPVIDTTQGTVVLQQQLNAHEQRITAFDSNTGTPRWSTLMSDIISSSPTLVQNPNGTLLLFTTVANSRKVLFTPSLLRIIEVIIFALLLIGVLFSASDRLRMGFLYLQRYSKQFQYILRTFQRYTHSLFRRFVLLSLPVRMLVILLLVSILGGAGTLGYTRLNQFQNMLYQVNVSNGAIQWQQHMTAPAQAFTTDAEGSIITTSVGDHIHQLQALTPDGAVRWKTFTSQGIFSATAITSSPGTIVVELRGDTSSTYQFAPADAAYPNTIDHLLVLYVLNRSTGIPLWQHVLVYPDEQQHAVILGADANYIYVSSTQTHPQSASKGATLQLFAVNRITGTIDWRVFGPAEPNDGPHDDGQLLLRGGQAIWQVAGTIYAIDTVVGQIEWRRQITDDDLSVLAREDQMTAAAGALLVIRRHAVHALDLNNGNELWTLPSKGASTPQSVAGVSVAGQTILVYGNGQIEAFDLSDHHSLWRNIEFDAIQHVSVSDDGKTVYMIEVSNLVGSSPALVALDAQTGTTLWTFEPASQATFPFASPDSFLSNDTTLFITTCFPLGPDACAHQRLYALAAETGKPAWTFVGHRISDLHLSQDGKTLLFNVNSSLWSDLVAHL